jgi:hypothetical protein
MRVITFTPVRQTPQILSLFLERLAVRGCESWFYDDNDDPESAALLEGQIVLDPIDLPDAGYKREITTHLWPGDAVERVAAIKNHAIDLFLKTDATHLFLIDSDVILLPGTVDHLLELDVPVVSSVYWSRWQPNRPWMPNVWDGGHYEFKSAASLIRLAEPGHYEVGGLGACTLIERTVLEQIRFEPVLNFPMRGEDRWFCMRAGVHGIPLLADTCLTPFHVYRDDQLAEARRWTPVEAERWKADNLDVKWRRSFGP